MLYLVNIHLSTSVNKPLPSTDILGPDRIQELHHHQDGGGDGVIDPLEHVQLKTYVFLGQGPFSPFLPCSPPPGFLGNFGKNRNKKY